ncbi:MAG: GTPase Era, partial [Anaerolineales bacterium]
LILNPMVVMQFMTEITSKNDFRSGFVAVIGRPNVGKSTLINVLLKQKIAAVSPRPQTTRRQQLGILTTEKAQIIFVDTPGFHSPRHKLGEKMVATALAAIEDADALLLILDSSEPLTNEDELLIQRIKPYVSENQKPLIVALNKIDLIQPEDLKTVIHHIKEIIPQGELIPISSTHGDNLDVLLDHLTQLLPISEPLYPEEQLTDLSEREIAADLIREAALNILRDEVPHGIAVRIDQYQEKGEGAAVIFATIIVERESHKGIVIGANGNMIKRIGIQARQEIEAMSGRKVYLNLKVKVQKNWRKDENLLKWLGY